MEQAPAPAASLTEYDGTQPISKSTRATDLRHEFLALKHAHSCICNECTGMPKGYSFGKATRDKFQRIYAGPGDLTRAGVPKSPGPGAYNAKCDPKKPERTWFVGYLPEQPQPSGKLTSADTKSTKLRRDYNEKKSYTGDETEHVRERTNRPRKPLPTYEVGMADKLREDDAEKRSKPGRTGGRSAPTGGAKMDSGRKTKFGEAGWTRDRGAFTIAEEINMLERFAKTRLARAKQEEDDELLIIQALTRRPRGNYCCNGCYGECDDDGYEDRLPYYG